MTPVAPPAPDPAGVVTALVVAADSGAVLRDCVHALLGSADVAAVRLLDNASRDGIARELERMETPRLQVEFSPRNLGFGAGMNHLAPAATTPWLLLVNPDVVLAPEALRELLALACRHPDFGILSALMVTADGRVDPASRRRDPLLRRALAQLGLWPGAGVSLPRPDRDQELEAVENVSGALLLVRRELFVALGGFDEGYFLHFEDLDLCRRARDAGSRVGLAAKLRVPHRKGSSSRHRPVFVARHKHRGMWRWLRKFDPAMRHWPLAAAVWLGIWLHFLLQAPVLHWRARRPR